jgi:hypothetical protein
MAKLVLPNGHGHGWRRDTFDPRDRPLRMVVPRKSIASIQAERPQIWLDPKLISPTRDQQHQGSCTGHATVDCMEWSFRKSRKKNVILSPADSYLGGRILEASVKEDSGCETRDVVKAAAQSGVCLEKFMPYNPDKLATVRSKRVITNALFHQLKIGYYRCDDNQFNRELIVDNMIRALYSDMPLNGGYAWLSCLDTSDFANTGVMPTPSGRVLGGHANSGMGVDIPARVFLWHNSWGDYGAKHPISGQEGFVIMPFSWILVGACDDCWAIRHE